MLYLALSEEISKNYSLFTKKYVKLNSVINIHYIILCNTAVHMYKETENINIYLRRIIIDIDIQFCVVI